MVDPSQSTFFAVRCESGGERWRNAKQFLGGSETMRTTRPSSRELYQQIYNNFTEIYRVQERCTGTDYKRVLIRRSSLLDSIATSWHNNATTLSNFLLLIFNLLNFVLICLIYVIFISNLYHIR